MTGRFFPKLFVDKVQDIDLELLKKEGITGLILDIDNTLVPYRNKEADENAVKWIEYVKSNGLKACIVSNNSKKRVIKFNENLKLPAIHKALKPGKRAFLEAARLMDSEISATAVIGDQIFTDILGGNRLGMYTILVKPIDKNEEIFIKFKRIFEKVVIANYLKSSKK